MYFKPLSAILLGILLNAGRRTNGVPVDLLLGIAAFLFATRGLQGLLEGNEKYVLNFSR